MTFLGMLLVGWLIAAGLMVVMFFVQKKTGDAGVVDISWSLGVVGLTMIFSFCPENIGNETRLRMVLLLVFVWGLRLSLHVLHRYRNMPPDGRYEKLKEQWGSQADWRIFRFYQMQGVGIVLFVIPPLLAMRNPTGIHWLDFVGLAIGVISILGEGASDWQLSRFRSRPDSKGRVCKTGLWKFSRHPNYFFETLHWTAYVFLAILWVPWGWGTLIGPLAMWYFLTRVTGIPQTEAQAVRSRGDAYREYQRTTNAFFPWFPRK